MDNECDRAREQMADLLSGDLTDEQAAGLRRHTDACAACRAYLEGLQADDRLLVEFAEAMQVSVVRIERKVAEAIEQGGAGEAVRRVSAWRVMLKNPLVKLAAAAVIVAAVVVAVTVMRNSKSESRGLVKGQDVPENKNVVEPQRNREPELQELLEKQMNQIRQMVASSDIDGLVDMLDEGRPASRLAAADYLARIGDLRAIETLERLGSQWNPEDGDNPFLRAVSEIRARLDGQKGGAEPNEPASVEVIPPLKETSPAAGRQAGCAGLVLDDQSRAVPNAEVLLYYRRSHWGLGNRVVEETVSESDGSFSFKSTLEFYSTKARARSRDKYILLALHPDYALGWHNVEQGREQACYEITLTKPVSRTITVTDIEGNPLGGARVWLYSAGDPKSANPIFRDYVSLPTDVGLVGAVTDSEGNALVKNLPQTGCSFHATLKGFARGLAFPGQRRIRLTGGATVSGRLLTAENEPISGAVITFAAEWMNNYFLAETNEQGHFSLEDLPGEGWDMRPWGSSEPASGQYKVTVKHERYSAPEKKLKLSAGQLIDDLLIEAYGQTTLIRCQVVAADSNSPLAGARIGGSNKIGRIDGYADANGVFAVRVLPGPVSLSFYSPPDGVYVLRENGPGSNLNFEAAGAEMTVTLRAPAVAGILVNVPGFALGPDGRGVSGAVLYASADSFHTSNASSYIRPVGAEDDGLFELKEAPAGRKLNIYAETKDHSLAGTAIFEVPAEPNESFFVEVKLQATMRASVVVEDKEGNIVPETALQISPVVGGDRLWPAQRRGRTDENGMLEIDGIVPGLEYYLEEVGSRRQASVHGIFEGRMVLIPQK